MRPGTAATAPRIALPTAVPNAIAIASGKGGVGKTWLAVTLSHALAQFGGKVLLFDADLGLANVDIQLGLMPKRDLMGVMDGTVSLAEARTPYRPGGFDVIAGQSGSGNLSSVPTRRLAELNGDFHELARHYNRILFDMGAGLDRTVRQMALQASTILVVATDEPTSLTDAYAFVKTINAVKPGADMRFVINMAASPRDGERTYQTLLKACQTFLDRSPPLAGTIRRDPKVREAIRLQTSLLSHAPGAPAALDVVAMARLLLTAS